MSMLPRIERFLRHSAMPPTLFGRRVANDPRLVGDLRNGREPGPQMCARIEAFLADRERG
ncbi:hypothetical protein OKW76_07915 [Sphingomonas sp. S1-29]|uniref:hypothetical protein n=1 Tax=Sphingomonas sp. S1-29 TaxID=2991074 RepID=UPI002240AA54|nr:hypothetical protein [Sphingomonas sp. S1-29]UZK70933.1 hypothetical protein OKW76_07915 [Sphingomonas sp. S1-29]